MLPIAEVSLVAVFASSVVNIIIGSLWYSPLVFGKLWMKSLSLTKEDIKDEDMKNAFTSAFFNNILLNFFLGLLIAIASPTSLDEVFSIVLITIMATLVPAEINAIIFEKRPPDLLAINGGYSVVTMLISATILSIL